MAKRRNGFAAEPTWYVYRLRHTPATFVGSVEAQHGSKSPLRALRSMSNFFVTNRSQCKTNRVSANTSRRLEFCDLRLAPEIDRLRPRLQKIEAQRLRGVPLTRGNVAVIFASRT
jgi:hypothetical protein